MRQKIIDIAGWYGVLAILLAYGLVSFDIVGPNSYGYQLLNLTGALGIVAVSISKKARQPAMLNLAWAVIALIALAGLLLG